MSDFKLWSELNIDAAKDLRPNLGLRGWADLNRDDKHKVWKHLEYHFFDKDLTSEYGKKSHIFYGEFQEQEHVRRRIEMSILALNKFNKAKSYAENYLEEPCINSACFDFHRIFMEGGESVVMELLSLYIKVLIVEEGDGPIYKSENETKEQYEERYQAWKWYKFDQFSKDINEVFSDFGLNVYLTRGGLIPRQEDKIMSEIYEPVLKLLSDTKWKKVNEILSDSFNEYRKNTPDGYSNCVTNAVASVEAFLQVALGYKIGSEKLSVLVTKAMTAGVISKDFFAETIFKNIESVFAKERQETGTAHPKKEYATEKNARMILNLAMIFIQHCIQK